MEKEENILGTEKIGKLMIKFSIPCIISMLVNALYNIVDQIFIGWGVGYLGNGATNVVFPLTVICLAFALMLGDGSSAFLSLKLGEKKKKEAERGVTNGLIAVVIIAILFCVITLCFLPQLLNIFGCTDNLRQYALDYGYIIAIGLPFTMIGTALNSIIRADGNPKFAMISMLAGAILNTILDPLFIFAFNMGIKGAAIATVISQFVNFALNAIYIKNLKSVTITKDSLKPDFAIIRKVSMLGVSSFITQMSFVIVMAVENNLLKKYGALSKYGADIPITVFGIVMKVNQILTSIIIGLAVGSQPILGYNYGAERYDRVKSTLKRILSVSVIISTIAFILFQTIPDKLITIFGSSTDENYMEFACVAFRTYLALCILNGIQIPSGIFFQAIGKSFNSALLSLSRQIIFLIPGMLIFGNLFGIKGLLYSGPFGDGLAFVISVILLIIEIKKLGKKTIISEALIDDTSSDNKVNKKVVITIARQYGSGGRYVGKLIADKLGVKFYDKEIITRLSEATGLSEKYIESTEQKRETLANLNNGYYNGLDNSDELFVKEANLIKELADKESCVIIGRCSDFILKDKENVVKIFIYGTMENRIKRAVEFYGFDKSKAEKEIKKIDKLRANHYKFYTNRVWDEHSNYDIAINSDYLGVEKTADLICEMIKEK